MTGKRAQKGFSIIEALAAVALVAAAFLPLLILQGQLTRTSMAVQRAETSLTVIQSALAIIETINPLSIDQGVENMGSAEMNWRAIPISDPMSVRDNNGTAGRFTAQLFKIEATVQFHDGRTATFTVHKMGWRAESPILN